MYPQLVKTKLSDPPLLHFLIVIFNCVAWLMLPLHKCGNDNGWTRIINKMYLLIWICLIFMVLVETQTGIHNREFLVLVWFLWFYSFWNFLVKEYKLSFDTKTRSCQIWNVLIVLCVCVCVCRGRRRSPAPPALQFGTRRSPSLSSFLLWLSESESRSLMTPRWETSPWQHTSSTCSRFLTPPGTVRPAVYTC